MLQRMRTAVFNISRKLTKIQIKIYFHTKTAFPKLEIVQENYPAVQRHYYGSVTSYWISTILYNTMYCTWISIENSPFIFGVQGGFSIEIPDSP